MNTPTPNQDLRSFIAIALPPELTHEIEQLQSTLNNDVMGIRWTKPQNCHLTLKFLGNISPNQVEPIQQALTTAAQALNPFDITLHGIGQFPAKGPAAVVWIGVQQGSSTLLALEEAIRNELALSNISFDPKKFVPHLTIGRVKHGVPVHTRALKHYETHPLGCMRVSEVHLMKSTLTRQGPIYETISSIPLAVPVE